MAAVLPVCGPLQVADVVVEPVPIPVVHHRQGGRVGQEVLGAQPVG